MSSFINECLGFHKLWKYKNSNGISVLPRVYTEFATKKMTLTVQLDFPFCLRNLCILCSKTGGFVTEELAGATLSSPWSTKRSLNKFPEFSPYIECKFKLYWPVASIILFHLSLRLWIVNQFASCNKDFLNFFQLSFFQLFAVFHESACIEL